MSVSPTTAGSSHDPIVWTSLWNNCLYAVISIVFQVFGAFLLAAIIEGLDSEHLRRFWRAVYFVPSAISITVTGLLFYFIYQPEIGLLDALLRQFGLGELVRPWLGDEHTAIYAIIAMSQWQGFGYSTLLFAVAIQKIPRELLRRGHHRRGRGRCVACGVLPFRSPAR